MSALFFDTSAIVKRYVQETGTAWVRNAASPASGNLVYLARISAVEVASAVTRQQLGGSLSPAQAATLLSQFRQDWAAEYRIVEITPHVIAIAVVLAESHGLRAYDAVQLAAVVELHTQRITHALSPITLVSADQELNSAAAVLGLLVEDPNKYP